jgi:hypothetical protein
MAYLVLKVLCFVQLPLEVSLELLVLELELLPVKVHLLKLVFQSAAVDGQLLFLAQYLLKLLLIVII